MAGPAVGEAAAAAARARRAADAAAVAKARSAAKEAARRDKREYRALALRSGGAGAASDGDASDGGSASDGDADPTAGARVDSDPARRRCSLAYGRESGIRYWRLGLG